MNNRPLPQTFRGTLEFSKVLSYYAEIKVNMLRNIWYENVEKNIP
jgi:hypothetical protein